MRSHHQIVFALLILSIPAVIAAGPDAQKSFDQLKSLAGRWEGKANGNRPVAVSFRMTAGGTALLSEIEGPSKEDMISMFHLDGPDRLLLTHYCGAGNQPRMQATVAADGKTFVFDFLDATNLAHPEDGHMQRLVISVLDADHHTEEWTFVERGRETKEVLDLWRK
jgi:hypothetical protein